MTRRLEGQTAWISGAASGIAEATARRFVSEGARVALVDVRAEIGRKVESELRAQGGDVLFVPCDVTQEDQVRESIEQTVRHFGGLQILINAVGIVHVKPLHEYSVNEWDLLMNVNVRSIFLSVKHAIAHLSKNPQSYIVNIGSISSYVGQAATPAYTTSKGAVLLLSRSIALDYAEKGVRCNCVCPGITDTPLLRHHLSASPDVRKTLTKRLHRVPLGRALTPDDVARSILYLSCEDSAGITGTSLVVDGGYLAAAEWDSSEVFLPDDFS